MLKKFWIALGFLTVAPIRSHTNAMSDVGRAAGWFALVGVVIGGLLVAGHWLANALFPAPLGAALLVALWASISGGLHLDGFADCCDGLLAFAPPSRRLEIMHDPRLGAFGVAGLILLLTIKTAAVASLASSASLALVLSAAVARWLILPVGLLPSARPDGMGAPFAADIPKHAFIAGAATVVALAAMGGWRGIAAVALAHIAMLAVVQLARRRIGGITGDVFGAVVELAEVVALLPFAIVL